MHLCTRLSSVPSGILSFLADSTQRVNHPQGWGWHVQYGKGSASSGKKTPAWRVSYNCRWQSMKKWYASAPCHALSRFLSYPVALSCCSMASIRAVWASFPVACGRRTQRPEPHHHGLTMTSRRAERCFVCLWSLPCLRACELRTGA